MVLIALLAVAGCQSIHVDRLEVYACDGGNVTIAISGDKVVSPNNALSIPLIPGL
jgi:hypothetical protein